MPFRRIQFLNSGHCTQWAYLAGRPSWRSTRFYAVFVHLDHPVHGSALIDTGYSPSFFQATRSFPGRLYRWATPVKLAPLKDTAAVLEAHGVRAADIGQIFVSHFHGDHIAGLRHFPAVKFVHRPAALEALRKESTFRQVRHGFLAKLLPDDFMARGQVLAETSFQPGQGELSEFLVHDFWGDGDLLLVDLPGHAVGHMGFVLRTATETIFYVVDATWGMAELLAGRGLPWFSQGLQQSYADYVQTQGKLRRLAASEKYTMLACHCPRTQAYVQSD